MVSLFARPETQAPGLLQSPADDGGRDRLAVPMHEAGLLFFDRLRFEIGAFEQSFGSKSRDETSLPWLMLIF